MSENHLSFAIFGKKFQENKSTVIQKVLDILAQHDAEVLIDKPFFKYLATDLNIDLSNCRSFEGGRFNADFVITVGGDGTFLRAASHIRDKKIPLIGINTGRLGFLADVLPAEIEFAINAIYEGKYTEESHTVIQVEAEGASIQGCPYALNDIAVLKKDDAAMISVRTCVNGEYLVTYQADGLIISTPTGSTAYNLSNGGPIMVPDCANLCITPVAPHSLNIRPIVINDNCEVELEVESRSHNFLIAIDGRSEKLVEGIRLKIKKAPYDILIAKRHSQRYFSTLREKMMWGADQRQQ